MDIKKVITDRGFTLQQIGDALGITQQAVSKQLRGENVSVTRCKQIAKIIGVTLDTLVSDGDDDDASINAPALVCPHCGKPISIHLEPVAN